MKYRIIKKFFMVYSFCREEEYNPPETIIFFAVQVKGFLFWHTVKEFQKIRQACELLNILKQEE